MIIKQLYLWRENSDWIWKSEKFFAIILIGFACSGIIAYGIHYPFLRKREKTEAKQKEFDKFIKGC